MIKKCWNKLLIENVSSLITCIVYYYYFIVMIIIVQSAVIIDSNSHNNNRLLLLTKRDWKSTLPVPIPKPGEYSQGSILQFLNRKQNLDRKTSNQDVITTIDNTDPLSSLQQLNLTEANRCLLGSEFDHCPANLECRSLPHYDSKFNVCVQIDCSLDCQNFNEIHCPSDSQIIQQMIEIKGKKCCLHFCNCDENKCTVQKCLGSRPVVLKKAAKIPGKCCDQIECNPYIPKKCIGLNGEQYNTGDSWQLNDDCHRCNCIDGVQKCESIENCPYKCLPANHTEKLDSNQCCPRCKACIDADGQKHIDSSIWIDNCRRCECKNEKIICNSPYGGRQFCDRPCMENEHRQWQNDQCCDKCECNLNCPFGFQINSTDINHKTLCKCKEHLIQNKSIKTDYNSPQQASNTNHSNPIWILLGFAILIIVCSFCSYSACAYFKNHHHPVTTKTNYQYINQ
uniref:Cysteine-rich motor neuron 1 protein-like n=1 Tax=Dermatophagoides pteronyssinus TaxID=6956 RepID=A0A6P6YBC6_DERPT